MRRTFLALSTAATCLVSPLAQAESPAQEQPAEAQGKPMGGLGIRMTKGQWEKREDIRKLLVITGSTEVGIQVLDQLMASLRGLVPGAPEEFWTKFRDEVKPSEFVELLIPVYEKHLSHEDVRQMIAFYESPTGKKVIKVLPLITQESMEVGQAWGARVGEKVMREIMKAQGEANSR